MADELTPEVQSDTATPEAPPPISWDNPPPETPPAEAAQQAAPAPATPSETPDAAPQPEQEAQPAAEAAPERESQPEADTYVAEADDPPELTALTTPAAKRWAKRQYTEAYPTRVFLDTEKPIQAFGDDLYKRSPSRYWEHVDDVFANHKDYFIQKVSELNKSIEQPPTPSPSVTAPTTAITETELANLSDTQIVERFEAAQKSAREEVETKLRAEFDEKFNKLQSQFEEVNGKFTSTQDQAREAQVIQIESDLKTSVMKVVDEAAREWGLEPKADDPENLANLKKAAIKIIRTEFEPTFDADESNVKVVEKVREFAKRLERDNVFREEDNLKVRARAATEKVRQLPEMKAIMDQIVAIVEQSKAKPRAVDPAPPVAGAAAGVVIQPPTTWDDAYQQAKAAEATA